MNFLAIIAVRIWWDKMTRGENEIKRKEGVQKAPARVKWVLRKTPAEWLKPLPPNDSHRGQLPSRHESGMWGLGEEAEQNHLGRKNGCFAQRSPNHMQEGANLTNFAREVCKMRPIGGKRELPRPLLQGAPFEKKKKKIWSAAKKVCVFHGAISRKPASFGKTPGAKIHFQER